MLQYADIHISELKNLSVKSFTQVLINDVYPIVYSEIDKLENCISEMKTDYDVELLALTQKKIYLEFDELFRKEKLVLFPFLIKLDEENSKSENCAPFKNIKLHYTSMMQHLDNSSDIVSNYFISTNNNETINCLYSTIAAIRSQMNEIQLIKDKHFYPNYKSCNGCKTINTTT